MTPLVFFAIVILVPAIVLTVLRVNAAVVFLSLCLGNVLVKFMGSDAISLVTTFVPHAGQVSESTIQIGLLLLPAVLTTIFMVHSVRRVRVVLNIVPALTIGLLGLLLVEPLLSPGTQGTISQSTIWQHYTQAQSLIVGLSALISLAFLWFERHKVTTPRSRGKRNKPSYEPR